MFSSSEILMLIGGAGAFYGTGFVVGKTVAWIRLIRDVA